MKRNICVVVAALSLTSLASCQETKTASSLKPAAQVGSLSKADLKGLVKTSSTAELSAVLLSEEGKVVASPTTVLPNTRYQLTIRGEKPASYVIRYSEGFDVVDKKSSGGQTTYFIKTDGTLLAERLFISIVPVVNEQNELKQQAAQGFLLPAK